MAILLLCKNTLIKKKYKRYIDKLCSKSQSPSLFEKKNKDKIKMSIHTLTHQNFHSLKQRQGNTMIIKRSNLFFIQAFIFQLIY